MHKWLALNARVETASNSVCCYHAEIDLSRASEQQQQR